MKIISYCKNRMLHYFALTNIEHPWFDFLKIYFRFSVLKCHQILAIVYTVGLYKATVGHTGNNNNLPLSIHCYIERISRQQGSFDPTNWGIFFVILRKGKKGNFCTSLISTLSIQLVFSGKLKIIISIQFMKLQLK